MKHFPMPLLAWVVLMTTVVLIYGPNLFFNRDLWVQDEARYGEAVREMLVNGHYLVPSLDGQFYADKPPLYFWLMVIQARLTGLNSLSFRLVTFFSLIGFSAAFFIFARRLIGDGRGLWAAMILLSSMLFIVTGNIVRMDVLLAFFVVSSLYFLLRAVDEVKPRLALVGYAFAIFGTMVKGPLGFAFPVLGAGSFAVAKKGIKGLSQLKLTYGLGLGLLVGGLWTSYLWVSGRQGYVEEVFLRQLWGRSVKSWSHPEPFYFYPLVLLPLFMPWIPFLWRALRESPREIRLVSLCWFLPGFVLISAISDKLFVYLVPLLPALALLVAFGLAAPWEKPKENYSILPGLLNGLFFMSMGGGLLYAVKTRLAPELGYLIVVALVPLLSGIVLIALTLRREKRALSWGLLIGSCLLSWVQMGWGAAQLNDYLSTRRLGLNMAEAGKLGYEPVAVDIARGTISFYARSQVRNLSSDELSEALDKPGLLSVAVRNRRRHRIPSQVLERLAILAAFPRLQFDGYTLYVERDGATRKVRGPSGS